MPTLRFLNSGRPGGEDYGYTKFGPLVWQHGKKLPRFARLSSTKDGHIEVRTLFRRRLLARRDMYTHE